MNKTVLIKIIEQATKECQKNFDKHKMDGFTIGNKSVIPFISKTLTTRVVSDWGTDEDKDKYLWYSIKGWQICYQTTQSGAGVQKVVSENINNISEKDVLKEFESMTTFEKMEFIHDCYDILSYSEYKYEL
ncbi:hypothetical protein [Clostridium butyricum]|uniref:hypothetical protein n=1 Tax=Clostridium butyricum TaxID=1492 RepID=UPI002AB224C6|nr:hypothetical protein [Clostridium butyricum]